MAEKTKSTLNTKQAKSRLARLLFHFALLLAIPICFLLWRIYQQIQTEAFFRYRGAAEEIVKNINGRVFSDLTPEIERPFDQYTFWNVSDVAWNSASISPLANVAYRSNIPGVVGYFQIDPDGSFHSPILPEISSTQASNAQVQAIMSAPDMKLRLERKDYLAKLLGKSQVRESTSPNDDSDFKLSQSAGQNVAQQRVSDLSFDQQLYQQQRGIPSSLEETFSKSKTLSKVGRKEQVQLIEQGDYTSQALNNTVPQQTSMSSKSSSAASINQNAQIPVPKVTSFEGEIDPFQFHFLPKNHFAFVRRVWREQQRYVQGFVVDGHTFIEDYFKYSFATNSLASQAVMRLAYKGNVISTYGLVEAAKKNILIFRTPLAFPFENFEVIFSVASLNVGSAVYVVHLITLFLALLIPSGLFVIYRLGAAQIELAQQRSNFVSAVSHELKTPLTSIRMYSEMLRSGWNVDEAKKQSYYDFIFTESERLSRLISNVLKLSELSHNDSSIEMRRFGSDELLDLIHSKVKSQVESAQFTLQLEREQLSDNFSFLAEEDAIVRIFINLVDNALKFSRKAETKSIHLGFRYENITADRTRAAVLFFVRDFGPGIALEHRKKLFQLFYRGENELTRATPGTGIGLALVKELANKINAQVDFKNMEPGVEFSVRLKAELA